MLSFFATASYLGAQTVPEELGPGFDTAGFYGNFVQVIITLAVIIGIIVLLIRFLAKKNKQWAGDRSMRVLGGVTLGQHKSMQVVEIGGTVYIVGVGENITLLDKITDEDTLESILLALEGGRSTAPAAVVSDLTRWISRWKAGQSSTTEDSDSAVAFKDLLQLKLKNVTNRKAALRGLIDEEDAKRRSNESP